MAWVQEEVYVLTAFFKDDSYSDPSEEFFAKTFEEAEKKQAELLEDDEYEDVLISDEKQEREFWYTKEELEKKTDLILIDDVITETVKDRKFKKVSFWNDNGRYSCLVGFDAVIPEKGSMMQFSRLIEQRDRFAKLISELNEPKMPMPNKRHRGR